MRDYSFELLRRMQVSTRKYTHASEIGKDEYLLLEAAKLSKKMAHTVKLSLIKAGIDSAVDAFYSYEWNCEEIEKRKTAYEAYEKEKAGKSFEVNFGGEKNAK
jgi:hypothetical protein